MRLGHSQNVFEHVSVFESVVEVVFLGFFASVMRLGFDFDFLAHGVGAVICEGNWV